MVSVYTAKARLVDITEVFLAKNNCPECEKPLIQGFDRRYINLTVNHIDFDRTNNTFENYNVLHRNCHIKYHKRLRKHLKEIEELIACLFGRD